MPRSTSHLQRLGRGIGQLAAASFPAEIKQGDIAGLHAPARLGGALEIFGSERRALRAVAQIQHDGLAEEAFDVEIADGVSALDGVQRPLDVRTGVAAQLQTGGDVPAVGGRVIDIDARGAIVDQPAL